MSRAEWFQRGIFRAVLFLYPSSFRREYGADMTQVFFDRIRDRGAVRTWLLVIGDLPLSVPQQILEATMMNQMWMAVVAAAGTAVILATFVLGAGAPVSLIFLGVGLFAGLLSGLSLWSARRNGHPAEFTYSYGDARPQWWTWWTVLAMLLGVAYVVGAVLQLIADFKGTNIGAVGIALAFAGLIFGGLMLRSRSRIAGNWMVVVATVPALAFFWVIVPAVVAIAIIIGSVGEVAKATPRESVAV